MNLNQGGLTSKVRFLGNYAILRIGINKRTKIFMCYILDQYIFPTTSWGVSVSWKSIYELFTTLF